MKKIRDFAILNIGILATAVGLHYFLIPANLAVGGVTGFAMVVNAYLPFISIGTCMFIMNILLFVLAFLLIGKEFGANTIYSSFALTGLIALLEGLTPLSAPLVSDLMINLIYGIVIQGIGMGILFHQNASTGGTDIIAKILNRMFKIDIGKSLLLSDFLVTLMAGMAFGPVLGMYAVLGIVINAAVIDNLIEGLNRKISVSVISKDYKQIQKFILEDLERGATLYRAQGAYSGEEKAVVNSILSRREFVRLKQYVHQQDKMAFVTASNIKEVLGEGFAFD
ncbi:YitT family protein [Fusibacter sp. JL216-2]|uniref:YitT family protein n=1 Tax=Fusibacter sp. JL216-2 TaxID=3071453 RepID=UPI003D34F591